MFKVQIWLFKNSSLEAIQIKLYIFDGNNYNDAVVSQFLFIYSFGGKGEKYLNKSQGNYFSKLFRHFIGLLFFSANSPLELSKLLTVYILTIMNNFRKVFIKVSF